MPTKALVYEDETLNAILLELKRARSFSFAIALVTQSGLGLLRQGIEACLARRGSGEILVGVDLPSDPEALAYLTSLEARAGERLSVRVFMSPQNHWFHPKVYLFRRADGSARAIVGSSNMTGGGLHKNYEASIWTDESAAVDATFDYFDEVHQGSHAQPITPEWLREYRRLWREHERNRRAADRIRTRVRAIGSGSSRSDALKQIEGTKFVFTGGIADWPRERKLYPRVKALGGLIGSKASALSTADFLVHGNRLEGRKATVKLRRARRLKVPILSEETFLRVMRNAKLRTGVTSKGV